MSESPHATVWPTVESIPVSAVTDDRPPGHLRPPRPQEVAGTVGTGRDAAGGTASGTAAGGAAGPGTGGGAAGPATGVGTAGARGRGARGNPAAELGFSGDPGQHGVPDDDMLHAQRTWDGTLATNRMDDLGVNAERQRVETKDVTASVGLVADGRPQDVRACVESLVEHTGATILALDLGDVDGAGDVLAELAERHPERIRLWRVADAPQGRGGGATLGAARMKLLHLDSSEVHVLMDTSLVLEGDALTPLVAAVKEGAVAAGRQGLEPAESGDRWRQAGPGRVRALSADLMAVRRSAALAAFPERADSAGDADVEFSLALRGELVVPPERLPVRRLRERDVAPEQAPEQAPG
ncbi:glycosyltransferase family 2 protein [Nonomuraea sp. ZG12]|uniref:glycosyltransferase family 2 protein n=1 Tax=Nonomuraea sp. ZG12 TaxID=3452207 RepID=UPI003F8C1F4D